MPVFPAAFLPPMTGSYGSVAGNAIALPAWRIGPS